MVRVFEDKNIIHVHNKIDPVGDIEIIQTELELADLQTKEKRADKKNKDLPALDLLSDKKVIFVLNVSESQMSSDWQPGLDLLKAIAGRDYVVLSTPLELILSEATEDEKNEYLTGFNMKESGLDKLIKQSYKTLGLVTFLTTGEDETRAWTANIGDPIARAARAIHTDFERLFIRAEVINWKTLLEASGYSPARTKGLVRTVGRDYIIQEGDVVEVKI